MKSRRFIGRVSSELVPAGGAKPSVNIGRLTRGFELQCRRYRHRLRGLRDRLSQKRIHEFRIEARRLLALLALLAGFLPARPTARIRREVKQQLASLSSLRDTTVQLAIVAPLVDRYPKARPFRSWLRQRLARLRRRAQDRAHRFRCGRLRDRMAKCSRALAGRLHHLPPAEATADILRALEHAWAETHARQTHIEPADTTTIHRTRIAFKRFRYMVEVLAKHGLPVIPDYLESLRAYQASMGHIQDVSVLLRTLERFIDRHPRRGSCLAPLCPALSRHRAGLIQTYLTGSLATFWPPQRRRKRPARRSPIGQAALTEVVNGVRTCAVHHPSKTNDDESLSLAPRLGRRVWHARLPHGCRPAVDPQR